MTQDWPDEPPDETLRGASGYLRRKSYPGDDARNYMNQQDWNIAICTAIGILDDTLSRICLDKETYDA